MINFLIELLAKLTTVSAFVFGFYKYAMKTKRLKSKDLIRIYNFSKKFIHDLEKNKDQHPLTTEKGFSAITGKQGFSVPEITYLLEQKNPSLSIEMYALTRTSHVEYSDTEKKIKYKKLFQNKKMRKFYINISFILYFIFAYAAFFPIFFFREFFDHLNGKLVATVFICFAIFISFGFVATLLLLNGSKITKSEKLVENQTQK